MADSLWGDVQGQLLWALIAVAGATLLPGRGLVERLALGRSRLGPGRLLLAVLGFLALSNGLNHAVVWLGLLEGSTLAEIDGVVREAGPRNPLLVWLAIGLAPAVGEELLFRGLVLRGLALWLSGARAVLLSAAVFGAAHLDPVHGVTAFLLGSYLGALAWRAGSLRAPMLCHALNNSLAVLAGMGAAPVLVTPAGPWQAALAITLALGCLALALRRPRLQAPPPAADEAGVPRGPDEGESDSSGPGRR
jgi:membrane protease YdiL (CAAX protease family)